MPWSTLVEVETLAEHLDHPDWVIVDCRFDLADTEAGRHAWQQAHIPGAVYAHLDEDLSGPVSARSGRHPLPDPAHLVAWLERHGVGSDTQVVAYDAGPGAMAARLWWLLRWLGHDAVAVLNGGLAAWRDAGCALTDEAPNPRPARFLAQPGSMPTVEARTLADNPDRYHVVDARAAERYRGESEPIDPVAGHIPGARNRPFSENLDDDGRLLPPDTLAAHWRALLGEAGERQLVSMCGSGITACHHLLALTHAGIEGAALYPGSWSEWIRDPERPVATGE
ncbi:MAG: sulfurtransferase [Ectothiorhodospiraceae bacterium]|jgi:thiosulfate/3-mercaptopyruvate sulfurtransferase